jgi:hypothetical protein
LPFAKIIATRPSLEQQATELNKNLKVLSVTAAGLLQVPDDSSLSQELQHETVKAKLAQARLLAQKFPSLAVPPAAASGSGGTPATVPLVTVANVDVEAMRKVGAVPGALAEPEHG